VQLGNRATQADVDAAVLSSAKMALRVSVRLVAEQSGARWHFSKRVFVMQATKDRFHEDERVRRQAVAVF